MRKFSTLLLMLACVSFASAQPKSPVEPKSPAFDEKAEKGKSALEKSQSGREYRALVVYADGSKIRGVIVLTDEKISSSCFCGNTSCEVGEKVESIASIEFTEWEKDSSNRRFRHSRTILQLRDGSKLYCTRIPAFDRFALKREGKTIWCYTLYYGDNEVHKLKKKKNAKPGNGEEPPRKSRPHPRSVRKIEFLREEGKSILDFLPLMMK